MRKFAIIGLLVAGLSAAPAAAQEKVVFGGSGVLGDAADGLVKAYKQKYPADTLEVIHESMSTAGGIEGTKMGRLTVGIIGRPVNDKEKKEGLTSRPVARMPVIIAVHKSNSLSNLSETQVCDIFNGKAKSWKDVGGGDGKITVLGRKAGDSSSDTLREMMTCFKSVQLTPDAILLVRGNELLDALNNRPNTVGATTGGPLLLERPNIKPVALAGITPSVEAVKTGKYKYFNEIEFVTMGEPKGLAKRFIDFVTGPEGEKAFEKYGIAGMR